MTQLELPKHFLSIDEHGYLFDQDTRIEDVNLGFTILKNLYFLENGSFATLFHHRPVLVESFDAPLVAQIFFEHNGKFWIEMPYHFQIEITEKILKTFYTDEWDRFYGELENGIPFVLNKKAQEMFFDSLDEFDDESFVLNKKTYSVKKVFDDQAHLNGPKWWNQIYESEPNPGWNLNDVSEALKDMLSRLKLPKSKILVLGCGDGYDAAFFAEHGHVVTAVDISPHAIKRAKDKYGHLSQIEFLEIDLFKLPSEFINKFDIVYEYTCFCAIDPEKRNQLVKIWLQCLHEQGQLMATFFCFHKRAGPPFGATEWEIRQRLRKNFQFLFWGRWRNSLPRRQGRELFVLAKKLK